MLDICLALNRKKHIVITSFDILYSIIKKPALPKGELVVDSSARIIKRFERDFDGKTESRGDKSEK